MVWIPLVQRRLSKQQLAAFQTPFVTNETPKVFLPNVNGMMYEWMIRFRFACGFDMGAWSGCCVPFALSCQLSEVV